MEKLQFLQENWIMITLVIMVIVYRKKILWEPLSGGNGHVHMDELAKFVIIALLVYTVYVEANRENLERPVFTDTFYLLLLGGVFSIAAIKPYTEYMKAKTEETQNAAKP